MSSPAANARRAAALALVLASSQGSASAQCFDWTSPSGPGLDGGTGCAVEFGGEMVIGGFLDRADGKQVGLVARWDGTRWGALGSGVGVGKQGSFSSERVNALAVFDDGSGPTIFAGGDFSGLPGQPALDGFAKWDATSGTWTSPGGTTVVLNGVVHALAVHDDGSGPALFVGGSFTDVGGVAAANIARWDGTTWQAVGGGTNGEVHELFEYGGDLLVAGAFYQAGGVAGAQGVARWDGTAWSAIGNGLRPVYVPVITIGTYALEVFDDGTGPLLYAGGQFEDSSGARHELASWDGTQWTMRVQGTQAILDLHVYDDGNGPRMYAGQTWQLGFGGEPVQAWDGTSFTAIPLVHSSNPFTIASAAVLFGYDSGNGSELYAGGSFINAVQGTGHIEANYVARRDGSGWSALGSSTPDLNGSVEDYQLWDDGTGAALYAGGRFTDAGGTPYNRVARWNGHEWSALGSGLDGDVDELELHDGGSGTALYAGGKFTTAGGVVANDVARWDGQQWSAVGSGPGGRVRAMASFDDGSGPALYVGGGALPVTRWDGSSWTPVGTNPPDARSMGIHDDGSGPGLYVGFGMAQKGTSGGVWKWDGTSWASVGATDSRVGSLYSYDDGSGPALYAGGGFQVIGGAAIDNIARWRGGQWEPVGTPPLDVRVKSMTTYDDGSGPRLAAGMGYAVAWDGTDWEYIAPPGLPFSGPIGSIVTLEVWGNRLFMGRDDQLGSDSWGPSWECPPTSYCNGGLTTGGCSLTLSATGRASVTFDTSFDVLGAAEGGTSGIFYFGTAGRTSIPWGQGTSEMCVRGPLQRLPLMGTGGSPGQCDGALSVDFNQWMSANPDQAPTPGFGVWLQAWYRDTGAPNRGRLSNAVEFYVCP